MAGQGLDPRDFLFSEQKYSLYLRLAGRVAGATVASSSSSSGSSSSSSSSCNGLRLVKSVQSLVFQGLVGLVPTRKSTFRFRVSHMSYAFSKRSPLPGET